MRPRIFSRGRGHDVRGAAAVEFAIVLPLVLLLVCGIVDVGRMLDRQLTLTNAAREGARWVALGQGNPSTRVASALGGQIPAANVAITWSPCPANPPPSSTTNTTVTLSNTYTLITPLNVISGLFGGGIPGSVTITGQGVMRCGG
jgi:Flp pilus assembly protein TadG